MCEGGGIIFGAMIDKWQTINLEVSAKSLNIYKYETDGVVVKNHSSSSNDLTTKEIIHLNNSWRQAL